MIRFDRNKKRSTARNEAKPKKQWRVYLRRSVDALILVSLAVAVGYIVLLFVKVNRGYSQTQITPEHVVRLQIVHGPEERSLARDLRSRVESMKGSLAVTVVESVTFDRTELPHSFVISRHEDLEISRCFAEYLGLDAEEVIYKKLENNRDYIDATLVLGSDAESRILTKQEQEENQGES